MYTFPHNDIKQNRIEQKENVAVIDNVKFIKTTLKRMERTSRQSKRLQVYKNHEKGNVQERSSLKKKLGVGSLTKRVIEKDFSEIGKIIRVFCTESEIK